MKPSIPKGTRDFSPVEMARRNFIFNTIRNVYEKYGYQQIETPSMENLSSLEGKYGEEGDKLLFRILNSGPVVDQIKEKSGDGKEGVIKISYDKNGIVNGIFNGAGRAIASENEMAAASRMASTFENLIEIVQPAGVTLTPET